MPGVFNTKEHHCDYTDIFSFSQVTHTRFYSKGMIVILDTIEDRSFDRTAHRTQENTYLHLQVYYIIKDEIKNTGEQPG